MSRLIRLDKVVGMAGLCLCIRRDKERYDLNLGDKFAPERCCADH